MRPISHPIRPGVSLVLALLAAAGCSDDPLPTESDESHDDTEATEELSVDLTVTPDHVHILSEVTFTATVTDHHGQAVTDFDSLVVERKAHDAGSWSATPLELDGDSWVGTHTFASSGDYDIRVTGMRPGDPEMVVMHERAGHLHAARAHAEAGGYGIEFESIPGHVHEGDAATLRFWLTEGDAPVTGRSPEIHVREADGSESDHGAAESEPGVYEAEHTFGSAGDATAGLRFAGTGGSAVEAEFTLHVAHAH